MSQPCRWRAIGPQVGKQTRSPQASFCPGGASATWPARRPQQGPRRVRRWKLGCQGHRGHVLQGRGPCGTPQTCANEQGGVPQGWAGEGAKGRRGHRAGGHSSFHQPSGEPALTPALSTDSRGHTGRSGHAVPEQGCWHLPDRAADENCSPDKRPQPLTARMSPESGHQRREVHSAQRPARSGSRSCPATAQGEGAGVTRAVQEPE